MQVAGSSELIAAATGGLTEMQRCCACGPFIARASSAATRGAFVFSQSRQTILNVLKGLCLRCGTLVEPEPGNISCG